MSTIWMYIDQVTGAVNKDAIVNILQTKALA